jgi:crotonobetainyl-CoA:carnitine CoA-transferase CaiB-like acyl-CoA transferase
LTEAIIPHAQINTVEQVRALEAIANKLTITRRPDGQVVRMQPMGADLPGAKSEFSFPPGYGQHTQSVLEEAGIAGKAFEQLQRDGVVPA